MRRFIYNIICLGPAKPTNVVCAGNKITFDKVPGALTYSLYLKTEHKFLSISEESEFVLNLEDQPWTIVGIFRYFFPKYVGYIVAKNDSGSSWPSDDIKNCGSLNIYRGVESKKIDNYLSRCLTCPYLDRSEKFVLLFNVFLFSLNFYSLIFKCFLFWY